jgi:hypothetical protein
MPLHHMPSVHLPPPAAASDALASLPPSPLSTSTSTDAATSARWGAGSARMGVWCGWQLVGVCRPARARLSFGPGLQLAMPAAPAGVRRGGSHPACDGLCRVQSAGRTRALPWAANARPCRDPGARCILCCPCLQAHPAPKPVALPPPPLPPPCFHAAPLLTSCLCVFPRCRRLPLARPTNLSTSTALNLNRHDAMMGTTQPVLRGRLSTSGCVPVASCICLRLALAPALLAPSPLLLFLEARARAGE